MAREGAKRMTWSVGRTSVRANEATRGHARPFRRWLIGLAVLLIAAGVGASLGRDSGSGGIRLHPEAPPAGWILAGPAPGGGWEYLDCGRMAVVIVDGEGEPVGVATVLPRERDLRACGSEASGR